MYLLIFPVLDMLIFKSKETILLYQPDIGSLLIASVVSAVIVCCNSLNTVSPLFSFCRLLPPIMHIDSLLHITFRSAVSAPTLLPNRGTIENRMVLVIVHSLAYRRMWSSSLKQKKKRHDLFRTNSEHFKSEASLANFVDSGHYFLL